MMVDPLNERAIDEALASPLFTGGPENWYSRMIGTTPIGWELLVFECDTCPPVLTLITTR